MSYPITKATPETDDAATRLDAGYPVIGQTVCIEFARKLERERDDLKRQLEKQAGATKEVYLEKDAYKEVLIRIAGLPSVLWDEGTTAEFTKAAEKVLDEYEQNKTTT